MIDRSQLPSVPVETPHTNGQPLSHGAGEVSTEDSMRALAYEIEQLRLVVNELLDMARHLPFLSKFRKH